MDRQTVYPGQILPETALLQMAKDSMVGLAKLSASIMGTGTIANGFAVTPTGPASLQVVVAPGELYSLNTIDATAWSSLAADTTHSIVKQGISLDTTTLNCAAPTTTGQSVSYLIQATYLDLDSTPVLLPYYNSANPSQPYSGLGNNGLTQNTARKGTVVLQAKAGAAAATGSQVIPGPDAGYVGLYVVTVAYAQTAISAASITRYSLAPLLPTSLLSAIQGGDMVYAVDIGTANSYAASFTPAVTTLKDGQVLKIKAANANTGACTFNPNGLGASPIVGSAHSALQGGEIVISGDIWLQWNSTIGSGSWVLIDSTGGSVQVPPGTKSSHAVQLSQLSQAAAPAGSTRNGRMSVATQSATATYTADEIVVETGLGGIPYRLTNFSKTINLASTGAGGMDTGIATAAGFIAIYAIYNPVTGASALLAANANAARAPEVYSGTNMPSGYTASALLTVVPIGAAGTIAPCAVRDRAVHLASAYAYTTQSLVTSLLVTVSTVPLNAISISGTLEAGCTVASQVGLLISDGDISTPAVGLQSVISLVQANGNSVSPYSGVFLNSSRQVIVTTSLTGSGTATYKVATSGYTI